MNKTITQGDNNMKNQVNLQSLEEIKSLIEENNASLREAILALKILSNHALQQPDQEKSPIQPTIPQRNYPGYTTPPYFGFME